MSLIIEILLKDYIIGKLVDVKDDNIIGLRELWLDANVRVYVPMDINADGLIRELSFIHSMLGPATERNEYWY